MYNEQIENLINLALADGELTEKEKQVLFKKAEAAGIDIDEFEMVLEAKLHSRQKEGVASKSKDNVIKCPSCNDIIPALSRICPSCNFVIDAGKKSTESQKGLEDLIGDIENNLVEIKSIPQPNIFNTLQERSYITLPLLTIIICAVGFRLGFEAIAFLGLVLAFFSYKLIKRKMNEGKSIAPSNTQTFSTLKANFEKYSRTAKTLFGENKKVKLLLEELNNELSVIEQKRKSGRKFEFIGYILIAIVTVIVFIIPAAKDKREVNESLKNEETALVIKADNLLKEAKISEATAVLSEVKSEDNKVLIRSKIQLYELNKQLDELEPMLKQKKFSELSLKLGKINWAKISTEYGTVDVERDVMKNFITRKAALNSKLPKNQQVEIESIYSL